MQRTVLTTISEEAGEYESALGRARVEVFQTGAGLGPNAIREVVVDGADMVSGHVQFPVVGRTTIGDDQLAVLTIVRAPAGGRWCERDLEPDQVMLYGPGAEHWAVSPPGLEYRYAIIELSELHAIGELLGTWIRQPERGSVTWLAATAEARELRSVLVRLGHPLDRSAVLPSNGIELFEATAHVVADPPSRSAGYRRPMISNRSVVSTCVDYVDHVGGVPSVSELCRCAHVSDRRLRSAFNEVCGLSPIQFFRLRLLGLAREQLLAGDGRTVSGTALDLGFSHLGRFANRYKQLFGEPPSQTLRAGSRSTVRAAS